MKHIKLTKKVNIGRITLYPELVILGIRVERTTPIIGT